MKISKRITGMGLVFIMMLCITLNFPIRASAITMPVTGFFAPIGAAVDNNSGNIYVAINGESSVIKIQIDTTPASSTISIFNKAYITSYSKNCISY